MENNFYKSLPSTQILPSKRSDVDGGTGSWSTVLHTQLWVEKGEDKHHIWQCIGSLRLDSSIPNPHSLGPVILHTESFTSSSHSYPVWRLSGDAHPESFIYLVRRPASSVSVLRNRHCLYSVTLQKKSWETVRLLGDGHLVLLGHVSSLYQWPVQVWFSSLCHQLELRHLESSLSYSTRLFHT